MNKQTTTQGNRRSHRLWALALVAGSALLFLAACTDAERASLNALGKRHKITLYGNSGTPIQSWTTTGAVTDVQGDGCYFEDEKTGLLVEIRGTMIIEVIK